VQTVLGVPGAAAAAATISRYNAAFEIESTTSIYCSGRRYEFSSVLERKGGMFMLGSPRSNGC
jgi:hypothetical protein